MNQIVLITTYYNDDSPARQKEIDDCLINNLNNKLIDEVVIFSDRCHSLSGQHPKLITEIVKDRLMYNTAFEYSNERLSGNICILANSDIFFDDTLRLLRGKINWDNKFYAITRHNVLIDGSLAFTDSNGCQDVWIFRSPIKSFKSDFELGRPGCDNRIVWEAKHAGLIVLNPCKVLVCRHLHLTKKYNYVQNLSIIPGPYEWANHGDKL